MVHQQSPMVVKTKRDNAISQICTIRTISPFQATVRQTVALLNSHIPHNFLKQMSLKALKSMPSQVLWTAPFILSIKFVEREQNVFQKGWSYPQTSNTCLQSTTIMKKQLQGTTVFSFSNYRYTLLQWLLQGKLKA